MLETISHFDPAVVRASLCVLQPDTPGTEELQHQGIPVTFINRAKRDPRRITDVNRIVRNHPVDLLHLLGPKSCLYGRMVGRYQRIPTITHFHSLHPDPLLMATVQRHLARWTAAAIAPSYAARNWAISEYGIDPAIIRVIHDGQDLTRFTDITLQEKSRVRRKLDIDDDAAVIGLIGRVQIAQKGQDIMIRLMSDMRRRFPGSLLLIVGEGPDLDYCRHLAQQLNITNAVRFTGYRDDIPQMLAATDVVVIPSVWEENFPHVAIEAAAVGRPVVAFERGGIPEAVLHDTTGIIVPQNEPDRLRDALIQILEDGDLSRRLADQGPKYAARFTIEAHLHHLLRVYREILSLS